MNSFAQTRVTATSLITGASLLAMVGWLAAAPPAPPKVSEFAPAKELVQQMDFYVGQVGETLADAAGYNDDAKETLRKDASTIVVLAQALGLHDEENAYRAQAGDIAAAAVALYKARGDHAKAAEALAGLRSSLKGEGDAKNGITEWKKLASLGAIMEQVPVIDARIQRSISPRRFKRRGKNALGDLATMAVIGQAALVDTHEVKDDADLPFWYELSAEMRDSARDMAAGVRAGDLDATSAAAERLVNSCDNCHADFREEE